MSNGNLLLGYTDLVLSGNAGMDVRIGRTYNNGSFFSWSFGLDGVPSWVTDGQTAEVQFFTAATGETDRLYQVPNSSDVYVSQNFWRYTKSTRTLQLPNGWTATYTGGTGYAVLQEVHDPFGNSLTTTFGTVYGTDVLTQVIQSLGNGEYRTVTLTYGLSWAPYPTSVTAVGHTWTYSYELISGEYPRMTAAQPPAGPAWTFSYTGSSVPIGLTVTTPAGGTVHYAFAYQSDESLMVVS